MKTRKNIIFLLFCTILTVGIVFTYGTFKAYFESGPDNLVKAKEYEIRARKQNQEVARLKNQLKDLQFNTVLALSKDDGKNPIKDQLLQSTRSPASAEMIDFSEVEFQRAKVFFDKSQWSLAVKAFASFSKDYPISARIPHATFYLGESYFKLGRYKEMLDVVEFMATQFPESELTGFLMLRQVQVSISTHQLEEAKEICQLIREEYKNPVLMEQVDTLEKSLQL